MDTTLHFPTPSSVQQLGTRGLDLRQEFATAYVQGNLHTKAGYQDQDPAVEAAAQDMYAALVELEYERTGDRVETPRVSKFSISANQNFKRAMIGAAAGGALFLLTGCGDDTVRDCVDANDNVVPESYCDNDSSNSGGGGFFFLYSGGGHGTQRVRASDKAGVRAATSKFSPSGKGFSSSPIGGKGGVGSG